MPVLIILFIIAYIIGSLNFAIILFKISGKGDPREQFSGNAGTTNVYRQAGKFWATVVLTLDIGKAAGLAFLSVIMLKAELVPLVGFALILGNKYPWFHGFRGGKGVASFLGFTAVLAPLWAGIAAASWVLVYMIVKIPFIASFFMISLLVIGTIIEYDCNQVAAVSSIITGLLMIFNHKRNIIEYINKKRQK